MDCYLVPKPTLKAFPREGLSNIVKQILNLRKVFWRTVLVCMDEFWSCAENTRSYPHCKDMMYSIYFQPVCILISLREVPYTYWLSKTMLTPWNIKIGFNIEPSSGSMPKTSEILLLPSPVNPRFMTSPGNAFWIRASVHPSAHTWQINDIYKGLSIGYLLSYTACWGWRNEPSTCCLGNRLASLLFHGFPRPETRARGAAEAAPESTVSKFSTAFPRLRFSQRHFWGVSEEETRVDRHRRQRQHDQTYSIIGLSSGAKRSHSVNTVITSFLRTSIGSVSSKCLSYYFICNNAFFRFCYLDLLSLLGFHVDFAYIATI